MISIYYILSHAASLGTGKEEIYWKNLVESSVSEKLYSIKSSKTVKGEI